MITIAQPLYGPVPNQAHISYTALCCRAIALGHEVNFDYVANAYIDRGRNVLARSAIDSGSTHILFVDHDMIVPYDALEKLMRHNLDVVGALYFCKMPPFNPVYVKFDDKNLDGWTIDETFSPGVSRVGAAGAGCLLVKTSALKAINDHFGQDDQWFRINMPMGEDVWFGKRCEAAGIDVYLDSNIECGHVSDYIVTTQDHLAFRNLT